MPPPRTLRADGTHQPDGQRCAPEARAGDAPVARALQPVVEALVTHVLGHPVRQLQGSQQRVRVVEAVCTGARAFKNGFLTWVSEARCNQGST